MEREHFEILLEQIQSNFQLVFKKLDLVDGRFSGIDSRLDRMDRRFDGLDLRLDGITIDVRDIKRTVGLLHAIANDHETRLQNVEVALRDHLEEQ